MAEDELTKTREHRNEWNAKVEGLLRLGAPDIIVEHYQEIAKMSHREYKNWQELQRIEKEEARKKWISENPMREEVVMNIFEWFDTKEFTEKDIDALTCGCGTCLGWTMDPMGDHIGMNEDEFLNDLYGHLIISLAKQKEIELGFNQ